MCILLLDLCLFAPTQQGQYSGLCHAVVHTHGLTPADRQAKVNTVDIQNATRTSIRMLMTVFAWQCNALLYALTNTLPDLNQKQ